MFTKHSRFSSSIKPYVKAELDLAKQARDLGQAQKAFIHLEQAHVLGQEST